MKNPYGNVVLITGASSGIGKCTALALAKGGCRVYGGSRRAEGQRQEFGGGFFEQVALDVTNDASVMAAVQRVEQAEGRVDILINCAGTSIAGAVEDCTGGEALQLMDTNYAGVVRMVRAVLPGMRQRRQGLVINIGSVGGIFSLPFQTLYSSTKCALEALTEGLRIELAPWGVKAVLVEPGDTRTGFTAARSFAMGCEGSEYGQPYLNAIAQMEKDEENGVPPEKVAGVIMRLIRSKNPPVRRVVGLQYKAFVFLKRVLPARAVELILTQMYPKSGAAASRG